MVGCFTTVILSFTAPSLFSVIVFICFAIIVRHSRKPNKQHSVSQTSTHELQNRIGIRQLHTHYHGVTEISDDNQVFDLFQNTQRYDDFQQLHEYPYHRGNEWINNYEPFDNSGPLDYDESSQRYNLDEVIRPRQQQNESSGDNKFSNLINQFKTRNEVDSRKCYKLSVYRYKIHHSTNFAAHHVIVISDGSNTDITFGLTVNTKQQYERAKAEVKNFKGDKSQLEFKGQVVSTLYELAKKADMILDDNPHYKLLSNNCQNFCNKFLEKNGLPTYSTDIDYTWILTGALAMLVTVLAIFSIKKKIFK